MGLTRCLDYSAGYCTLDAGGGDLFDALLVQPLGDDAPPLPGDSVLLFEDGNGERFAVGGIDEEVAPSASPGGRRIYSRLAPGVVAAEIVLTPSGKIQILSPLGSVEVVALSASVTVDTSAEVTAGASVKVTSPAVVLETPSATINGALTVTGPVTAPTLTGMVNATALSIAGALMPPNHTHAISGTDSVPGPISAKAGPPIAG